MKYMFLIILLTFTVILFFAYWGILGNIIKLFSDRKLAEIANVFTAVGVIVTAVGLILAILQLRSSAKASRAQFIHELEVDSQRFQPIFDELLPIDGKVTPEQRHRLKKKSLEVFSALNFFEKVQLLIQNKTVDMDSIDSLFAGRFFLLVHSPIIQEVILLNESYKDYLRSISDLYMAWYNYRKVRGRPIILDNNKIKEILDDC